MNTHNEPTLRLLFIGNSHTYVNDLPRTVQQMARDDHYACAVTTLAHGGWTLERHAAEPEARLNILCGEYDYVILQERSHPFAPEEAYLKAARALCVWIREAGGKPVVYATWAKKDEPEKQPDMNRVQHAAADALGALLCPVGERWLAGMRSQPNTDFYAEDGAHASPAGSAFAARVIWASIRDDVRARQA